MIVQTQSGRIVSIANLGAAVVFITSGMSTVTFQAMAADAVTVGSLVLTVQVLIGPGTWAAVPSGAVTVSTSGAVTASITVVSPMMRVVVSTAGTSGPYDVFMYGQTAV